MKKILFVILCTGSLYPMEKSTIERVPKEIFYPLFEEVKTYNEQFFTLSDEQKPEMLRQTRTHAQSLLQRMSDMMHQYPNDRAVQSFQLVFEPMQAAVQMLDDNN